MKTLIALALLFGLAVAEQARVAHATPPARPRMIDGARMPRVALPVVPRR